MSDLNKFSAILSKPIINELSNPAISRENLKKIVAELGLKLSLHKQVINFLEVTAEARRIVDIKAIELNFIKLAKVEKNILEVEVFSSCDLDLESIQNIKEILKTKYTDKIIEITSTIKKDILGGLQIKIGSTIIDYSLKRRLITLNQQLQSVL